MKKIKLFGLAVIALVGFFVIYITINKPSVISDNSDSISKNIQSDIDKNVKISFNDKALESVIRDQISKPDGDILAADMESVYSVNIDFRKKPVSDISGLEYAYNLHDFSFSHGTLKSLDPIRLAPKLAYLSISYADVSDMPALFKTPVLERINFIDTNVSNYDFKERNWRNRFNYRSK